MAKAFLSEDQAQAVLEKNLANIIKKSAAGKTLTRREQDLIAQFASSPSPLEGGAEWVTSYQALGKLMGLHRASFPRIVRNHPDAPISRPNGQHSVKAWREFLEKHPAIKCKSAGGSDPAGSGPGKSEYELEKLRQQCRRLKFENDTAEGLYVLKSEVVAWAVNLAERIKSILRSSLKNELPPKLEGLRAAEIAAKMDEPVSKICRLIQYCQQASAETTPMEPGTHRGE